MRIEYDVAVDILYVSLDVPRGHVVCLDNGNDVITRVDPETGAVLGFTVLQFSDFIDNWDALEFGFVKPKSEMKRVVEELKNSYSTKRIRRRLDSRLAPTLSLTRRGEKALA